MTPGRLLGLTADTVDPEHPFPFISNLSKNFAVVVKHGGRIKFARVKVPQILPRLVEVKRRYAGERKTRVQEDASRELTDPRYDNYALGHRWRPFVAASDERLVTDVPHGRTQIADRLGFRAAPVCT